MQEQGVQDVVNINKIKFEPYGDLVDEEYSRLNEILINIQDPYSQIENDEIPGAEYPTTMTQKTQKKTKLLQFLLLCHKYYQIMKSQKV